MPNCRPTRERNKLPIQMELAGEERQASMAAATCARLHCNHHHHAHNNANNCLKNSRRIREEVIDCEKRSQNKMMKLKKRKEENLPQERNRMLKLITSFLLTLQVVVQLTSAAMSLPDGIENILDFVPRSTFQCERDGYFGDIDNDCRIFHLCQKQVNSNGRTEWRHWTYACGNQTMFNQLTLTCAFVDEAIPCKHASQFQYLNEVIHKPKEPFLTDADVTSGVSYYSNRIMSDGARNRAFEDSRLMAQLGGQEMFNSVQASFTSNNNNNNFRNHQRQQRQSSFNHPAVSSSNNELQFGSFAANPEELEDPQRAGNSIAAHHQPADEKPALGAPSSSGGALSEAFERASILEPQVQPADTPSSLTSDQLIINHRQHFEHGPSQPAQHVFVPANDNNQQQNQQQFFGQPRSLFTAAAQLPAQPLATGGPHAFDFSIATNHQLNGPANEPAPQQLWAHFNSNADQFAPATAAPARSVDQTATENEPPTSSSSSFAPGRSAASDNDLRTIAPQREAGTTPSSIEFIRPATTTTTQRTLDPPTTLGSTTTTTITTRAITTTGAPAAAAAAAATTTTTTSRPRRRQAGGQVRAELAHSNQTTNHRTSNRQQQQQQRQVDHQNQLLFQQLHANFQSTRLSATQRRATQQPESSVVMRRHVQSSAPLSRQVSGQPQQQQQQQQPVASQQANQAAQVISAFDASPAADFWRRPFGAQLLAPRFESLLTRRRV